MASHVEANSLSDITQLAANPPKYPRNPTEQKRRPLTLYIARVPGTRDIILTTLKPQLKNVTAEDVASSLYYLHFHSEDDAKYVEEECANPVETESTSLPQKQLPRKPLPESARSSLELSRHVTAVSVNAESGSKEPSKRKPVPGTELPSKMEPRVQSKPPLSRRPLGPRTIPSETSVFRKPLAGTENQPYDITIQPQQSMSSQTRLSSELDRATVPKTVPDSFGVATTESTKAFNLTLIRRDPSSGSQWNIGTVSGRPTMIEGSDGPTDGTPNLKKPFFDMTINLTTPGYGPFRNSHLTQHIINDMTNTSSSIPKQVPTGSDSQASRPTAQSFTFDRQLRMEGSDFWSRSSIQHKRTKSDKSIRPITTRARSSSGNAFGVSEVPPDTGHENFDDSQAKGYIFLSPWGGRCKFSTSSSGRSLRCRHTIPEPVSARYHTESSPERPSSVLISEIKFNLPTADIFNAVAAAVTKRSGANTTRFSIPKFDEFRNKILAQMSPPALPPRPYPTSYGSMYPSDGEGRPPLPPRPNQMSFTVESSEDEPPHNGRTSNQYVMEGKADQGVEAKNESLDLSLGQEKAGGGNRGKRAKLGKLIIHDEGFKMLDLVVAANMAVWWSVWESDLR